MASEYEDRLSTELLLLEAMYAEQFVYKDKGHELTYNTTNGATLTLRIPDEYLKTALPEVLSANFRGLDLRDAVKAQVHECEVGIEILDSVIASFNEIVEEVESRQAESHNEMVDRDNTSTTFATAVIWLHHLLNTNKRKLALSPARLSGITKPGYPGVLVYSGPARDVHDHVNELKAQNWAAFQVRYESEELWDFSHGTGIVEVEAMKEVVAGVGEARKEEFMEAMRMK